MCVSDATGGLSKHQAREMAVGLGEVDRGQGQSRRRSWAKWRSLVTVKEAISVGLVQRIA